MQRTSLSDKFPLGSSIPHFSLRNVDDTLVTQTYFEGSKASLVVFTCNHCPYVKGSEQLLIQTIQSFSSQGLRAVAINANDPMQYPDDSFENMKAKAQTTGLKFPYLFDETQQVAKSFDAACSPEAYLFDGQGKLFFHGALNDSPKDASLVRKNYLAQAIEQLFSGESSTPGFVNPMGCSIKWKK